MSTAAPAAPGPPSSAVPAWKADGGGGGRLGPVGRSRAAVGALLGAAGLTV
ncbi:hypothetical protein ACQP1W_23700 [Spirillospora sp. CA-255316]